MDEDAIEEAETSKFSDGPLCHQLNSALNIEYVYLILLGINNFMENSDLNDTSNSGMYKIKINATHNKTTITMQDILIENVELWGLNAST